MGGTMHISHRQEAFSRAFVHAVAAAAGFASAKPEPDDDSVDLVICARGSLGTIRSPKLELQLKCVLGAPDGEPIRYALKQKNYDDLRYTDYQAPRILVVVFVPEDHAVWIEHTEDAFSLRYCAYWTSLYGLPDTSNMSNTTVSIPRTNRFTVNELTTMMQTIGNGGRP